MPDKNLLAQAQEKFQKALSFDAKAKEPGKSESLKKMANKAVDRYLDEAAELERQAFAS